MAIAGVTLIIGLSTKLDVATRKLMLSTVLYAIYPLNKNLPALDFQAITSGEPGNSFCALSGR